MTPVAPPALPPTSNAPARASARASAPAPEPGKTASGRFKVGTLRYTKLGLFSVFFWLLWGDFIWTLMEAILPNVMPLLMKDLGASNTSIQLLNKSLAYVMAFMLAPIISFRSDRHRGPRGRRIPYLLWSTPFVVAFLLMMGFYEDIGNWLMGADGSFLGLGTLATYLLVIGLVMVAFDFANMFVNCVYWYLFNDVVPEQFLSRFLSLFRVVGTGAGFVFSGWVFPLMFDKETQQVDAQAFKLVVIIAAVAYLVMFMAMCYMIKEGEYPPPPENVDKRTGFMSSAKTYFKECFTHKFYWYFFLTNTFMFVSWQSGTFAVLRNRDSLGISMSEIGWLAAATGAVSLLLQYPAGWLADKYNPLRVYFVMVVLHFFQPLAQCIWCFTDFGHDWNLYGQLIISMFILPIGALQAAAELPMYMRILPRERYGQFCSANAMMRAFAMALGAWMSGIMMDILVSGSPLLGTQAMGNWGYRYYAVWIVACQIPSIFFLWLLYREWVKRGGDKGYVPPQA